MIQIPNRFAFLNTIGVLPKLLEEALKYYGVHEVPGKENNPIIMNMAAELGLSKIYTSDDLQAWCALFMNYLLLRTGKPMIDVKGDLYNFLRAKYLVNYGDPVARGDEKLGDVVIMGRPGGGGHTTLWIAGARKNFWGYGANQDNAVGFGEFNQDRIIAVRRYYKTAPPASAKRYEIDSANKVSTDES